MSINRITFAEGKMKGFEGRTKTDEIETSELNDKQYAEFVEATETVLESAGWTAEKGGTWRQGAGKQIEDLAWASKIVKKLLKGKVVDIKPTKPAKEDKKDKPVVDKRRMKIAKEQRKRRSLRTEMEDALDAYVIDMIKSRRVLMYDRLLEVAKENSITVKGMDNGHRKMNVQNSLRARYLREESVFINGEEHIISKAELKKHLKAAEEAEAA